MYVINSVQALIDPESTETKTVYQLSKALLEESSTVSSGGTPSLYYALVLAEWILQSSDMPLEIVKDETIPPPPPVGGMMGLMSPSSKNLHSHTQPQTSAVPGAALFSPAALLKWGESHFEYWSRKGVAAEEFHLTRARQLFEQAFKKNKSLETAATLHEYCKILSMLGDMEAASAAALRVLSEFEHDSEYGNYLFYTGGIFKALGQHERANSYFFDASEVGPPRLFSKLEMMMIISRTIEEEHANDDTEEEDAYKMVGSPS